MPPSKPSTRWSPTPGQVLTLEELYRRGLRTPNASQIQKITTHLAFYGKIQYKNVFYWFQNHKARDRQKMRKNLAKLLHQQHLMYTATLYQPQQSISSHLCPYSQNYFQAAPLVHHHLATCEEVSKHENSSVNLPIARAPEVDPTSFPCRRSGPLQTLELFPLKPDHELISQTV